MSDDLNTPHSEAARTALTRMFLAEWAELLDSESAIPDAPAGTCPTHMARLARVGAEQDDLPLDKISRWLGFIQGVTAVRGMLSIADERDRTRKEFHAAYKADGVPVPLTIDVSEETMTS